LPSEFLILVFVSVLTPIKYARPFCTSIILANMFKDCVMVLLLVILTK
jgi:hypothetical protein